MYKYLLPVCLQCLCVYNALIYVSIWVIVYVGVYQFVCSPHNEVHVNTHSTPEPQA